MGNVRILPVSWVFCVFTFWGRLQVIFYLKEGNALSGPWKLGLLHLLCIRLSETSNNRNRFCVQGKGLCKYAMSAVILFCEKKWVMQMVAVFRLGVGSGGRGGTLMLKMIII